MEEHSNTGLPGGSCVGRARGKRAMQCLKLGALGLPLLQELFSVIKTEPGSLNTGQSSFYGLNLVLWDETSYEEMM